MFPELNFPPPTPKLKIENNQIWNVLEKLWLKYTPEEYVRQHLILFLHHHRNFPLEAMVMERKISVGLTTKRFDLLVYQKAQPMILVECKAPGVALSQKTLDQIGRYNLSLDVPYLILTNGLQHVVLKKEDVAWKSCDDFPCYL
jgi:predicted type IV restriction endonuclease